MAEPDLKRLVAEHDVARLLTEREGEILKRAARAGLPSIANLYGLSEAQAQREVDRIRDKLQHAVNGRDAAPSDASSKVAPGPASTPPRAQAPGPAEGSTRVPGGPSREERREGYTWHAASSESAATLRA